MLLHLFKDVKISSSKNDDQKTEIISSKLLKKDKFVKHGVFLFKPKKGHPPRPPPFPANLVPRKRRRFSLCDKKKRQIFNIRAFIP